LETDNVQVDAQGHYTALLGSASPQGLPVNLFTTGQAHWLAVQPLLQGFGEQPRVLLVGAPYASKAGDAETIGGLPPSAHIKWAQARPGRLPSPTPEIPWKSPSVSRETPSDFSFTTTCPATVSQGSCTVVVTYVPQAQTSDSANLTFTDADPTSQQEVTMTGTGS
jgi:hypothetical protein